MNKPAPIVLAIDTNDLDIAKQWVNATDGVISVVKLGLEFYTVFGNEGVKAIADSCGTDIFLDLKLHDIPHTVAGAARAVSTLRPKFLTVHAAGGSAMTSLSEKDVSDIGFKSHALDSAVGLAKVAVAGGARAIVCSPLEILAIRENLGDDIVIITPGVRPADSAGGDDQARTMTPREAIDRGANFVVIGRPITQSFVNGAQAMRERAIELAEQILN